MLIDVCFCVWEVLLNVSLCSSSSSFTRLYILLAHCPFRRHLHLAEAPELRFSDSVQTMLSQGMNGQEPFRRGTCGWKSGSLSVWQKIIVDGRLVGIMACSFAFIGTSLLPSTEEAA